MKKVLNIPGGGAFGFSVAASLYMIGADPHSEFDVFSGTSVGSILSACYAKGMTSSEVYWMMKKELPNIFKKSFWRFGGFLYPYASKYSDEGLNKALKSCLDVPFSTVKPMFATAVHLDTRSPKIFDNVDYSDDTQWSLWEIARMSSAAPTYFKPYKGYVDGGLIANNPAVVSAVGLVNKGLVDSFEEIKMLTINVGINQFSPITRPPRSVATWIGPLMDIFMEGGNEMLFEKLASTLPMNLYLSWPGPSLDYDWNMDDIDMLQELERRCKDNIKSFERIYKKITS